MSIGSARPLRSGSRITARSSDARISVSVRARARARRSPSAIVTPSPNAPIPRGSTEELRAMEIHTFRHAGGITSPSIRARTLASVTAVPSAPV
ncbi:hypothetical protein [Pseudonocardia endophytica]|nr:hypothetical protein [Pseudonocardia endophytica]